MLKRLWWSLKLDFQLLFKVGGITLKDKLALIVLKYTKYIKDALLGCKSGSSVRVFQHTYYCKDIFSIASLQRVYCESYHNKKYLRTQSVIIDVGAHIGQFNFFCAHYLDAARVISIEPQKDCFEILKLNAMNPYDCIHSLVSTSEGMKVFYVSHTAPQHSSYVKDPEETYQEGIKVPSHRLDAIMKEWKIERCNLLKVDTEGSEYEVLQSSEESFEKIDAVLAELSVQRASTGDLFTTCDYILSHGYVVAEMAAYSPGQKSVDALFLKKACT